MKVKNITTWVWEQAIFAFCLALAVYGQVREANGPEAAHRVTGAVVAALTAFAAQKVRSGADRQREQDELHGVERARLACANRIVFWAEGAQWMGVMLVATSIMTSHTGWSVPAMVFTGFYGLWRRVYRAYAPVKSDDGDARPLDKRAEDLGNAVASAVLLGKEMREGESTLDTMIRLHEDATKWRMPAIERLIEILQAAQREGENLLDTAERLIGESQAYQAYARQSEEPDGDESETTVFTRPSDGLDDLIDKARDVVMTPQKAEEQRRSFAFGNASTSNPEITREMINRVADATQTERTRPQPAPVNGDGPALWPMIADDLESAAVDSSGRPDICKVWGLIAKDALARHEFGIAKYGVPLVANNGRDHLADAYQEALDGVVYMRAQAERDGWHTAGDAYELALDLAWQIRSMLYQRDGK